LVILPFLSVCYKESWWSETMFTAWQLLVVILLGLTAYLVFRGVNQLGTISRQLSNLYVLTAWKSVPAAELGGCSAWVTSYTNRLEAWEKLNEYRFLGNGMLPEEAHSAAHDEFFVNNGRWIAQSAPERIKNGCCDKKFPGNELCSTCAENYATAEKQFAEMMAKEKSTGKRLEHYVIRVPACPNDK
jgi:hypothetical protein